MPKSRNNIWSVLKIPPPGQLPSAGPGTGPTQADSTATDGAGQEQPFHRPIPATLPPNARGYGGGADSVQLAQTTERGEVRTPIDRALRQLQRYPPGPARPVPNQLYDNARSREAWKSMVVATAHGTFTPASGSNFQAVTLDQGLNTYNTGIARLDQFPRGTHAYPVLITFSYAPLAASGTGVLEWTYQGQWGGIPVPLGQYFLGVTSVVEQFEYLIDSPITDPGNTAFGTLSITGQTVATPPALYWRLGFGLAYLVPDPAFGGYVDTTGPEAARLRQADTEERAIVSYRS